MLCLRAPPLRWHETRRAETTRAVRAIDGVAASTYHPA
jgi:hypothetical protein